MGSCDLTLGKIAKGELEKDEKASRRNRSRSGYASRK